jgi:pyruvate dehydrogenase E1 component alpha subunit
MHIADLSKGMMGANGIVGGGPPLICGAALSAKYLKTGGVAVAFVGDGASNQGTTFESYNLAKVWNLPPSSSSRTMATPNRPRPHGRSPAAGRARQGLRHAGLRGRRPRFLRRLGGGARGHRPGAERWRPSLLHVRLNRYYGHFEGDAISYKAPGEIEKVKAEKDALVIFRSRVTEAGCSTATPWTRSTGNAASGSCNA